MKKVQGNTFVCMGKDMRELTWSQWLRMGGCQLPHDLRWKYYLDTGILLPNSTYCKKRDIARKYALGMKLDLLHKYSMTISKQLGTFARQRFKKKKLWRNANWFDFERLDKEQSKQTK